MKGNRLYAGEQDLYLDTSSLLKLVNLYHNASFVLHNDKTLSTFP